MRLVALDDVEWYARENAHRGGGLKFKNLLEGVEDAPENYWLTLAKGDGHFFSPRHRHNFDQFRMCLEGRTNIDPKKYLEPGEVGYFPEGTPYGPQQDTEENLTLVLQFGGASGGGFMSRAQVRRAQSELTKVGTFEGGVFRRTSGEGRKNQDGFEALWEHVVGRKLSYPAPRFDAPIYMRHENFAWVPSSQTGVSLKTLGAFTERQTRLEMVQVDAGCEWKTQSGDAICLMVVLDGDGRCGERAYEPLTSIELIAGERTSLRAATATRLLRMVLPMLSATVRPHTESVAAE